MPFNVDLEFLLSLALPMSTQSPLNTQIASDDPFLTLCDFSALV